MYRLWRFEAARLIRRTRWLVLLPTAALVGYIGVDGLFMFSGADPNLWDGFLASFYNSWSMRALVLLPFIFLVGDTYLADRSSQYIWLALTRTRSRARWWAAKSLAVLFAAGVYVAGATTVVMLVVIVRFQMLRGIFEGPIFSTQFSSLALGERLGQVYGRSYQVFWPATPAAFVPLFMIYTSLALGGLALLVILPTLWWPRSFLPLGTTVALVVASHSLTGFHSIARWIPVWRLMYGWHFHHDLDRWPWLLAGSMLFFGCVVALSVVAGGRKVGRLDL